MIRSIYKSFKRKGLIPPTIAKKLNPTTRIWNNVNIPDNESLNSAIEGEIDKLSE